MSHNPEHSITCPNCGYHAQYNYCAQCGQETHLHADTFWGLVRHFVAHYFHYDSKFWQTIKNLIIRPGFLTLAYIRGQRARYITPISLYIFISAVYFLLSVSTHNEIFHTYKGQPHAVRFHTGGTASPESTSPDTARSKSNFDFSFENPGTETGLWGYLDHKMDILEKKHQNSSGEYLAETVNHSVPKIFFFTIPVIGFLLQLLFFRRKMPFADHAIFTLHLQSFTFLVNWAEFIPFPYKWSVNTVLALVSVLYLTIALHKVYGAGWVRSVLYSLLISAAYVILMLVGLLLIFTIILITA